MKVRGLLLPLLLAGSLAAFGCGGGEDGGNGGDGGSAATGGTAGSGGTGGTSGGATPTESGLYSYLTPGTYACLFVSEDRTKLVADASCYNVAFRFLTNRVGPCVVDYSQDIPIVDGKFDVQATQTDGLGDYTVEFSGEFSENGGVTGVASHSRDCPEDQAWQMSPGCCSRCDWCQ